MTNDELEKTIEFILNQQAQFASDIGQLKDIVTLFVNATSSRFKALEEKTDKRFADVDEKIAALVNSQIETEENLRITSENLKNITAAVDRYFRERNGKSEG